MHYPEFQREGVSVACVTRESVAANRRWADRLGLPYPLLSDSNGDAGRALGAVRRIPIGPWTLDLVQRSTYLIDIDGVIGAVWGSVKVRGHALKVLEYARAASVSRSKPAIPGPPSPPAA